MSKDFTQLDFTQFIEAGLDLQTIINGVMAATPSEQRYKPQPQTAHPKQADGAKITSRLRKAGDGLQKQIDNKLNPGIASQNPTARRARIAASMESEGRRLQEIQAKLYVLADLHESGDVPDVLAGIRYRSQIEAITYYSDFPTGKWDEKAAGSLTKAGINQGNYRQAKQALANLATRPQVDPVELQIRQLERDLIGRKIPGFFPTPKPLCERMVAEARIQPDDRILEPSAGKGNIAEVIREMHPDNALSVIEWQIGLSEILRLKRFNVIGDDFLQCNQTFDVIIQNPPFEQFQDVDHVKHAYSLLNDGGRLVSIMGESVFFRQDAKAVQFREWLDEAGGWDEKLPDGSFSESGTGVAARLVVVEK